MDMNITQLLIGAVTGGAVVVLLVLVTGLIRHSTQVKNNKEKDLITKTIGLLMSETNGLFTSYRLGDISFPEFEKKVRDLVSKINEEVNSNLSMLDSSYVSILGRYAEDKTESLLAIREALSGMPTSTASLTAAAPVSAPVADIMSSPASIDSGDDFSDFAASMEQNASRSDALFGGEQTVVQETVHNNPDIFAAAAEQTITMPNQPVAPQPFSQPSAPAQQPFSQPAAPVAQPFSQPAAPAAQPFSQPAAPVAQPFSQPVAPAAQPFSQPAPASQPASLDVEATQEFNVADIMSHAVTEAPVQNQNNNMVSGDDVANKLDSLFG